jgi:hypothetical protein
MSVLCGVMRDVDEIRHIAGTFQLNLLFCT